MDLAVYEFDSETGTLLSHGALVAKRTRSGMCVTCSNKLYEVKKHTFSPWKTTKIPLTIPGSVLEGRCLDCHPKRIRNVFKVGLKRKAIYRGVRYPAPPSKKDFQRQPPGPAPAPKEDQRSVSNDSSYSDDWCKRALPEYQSCDKDESKSDNCLEIVSNNDTPQSSNTCLQIGNIDDVIAAMFSECDNAIAKRNHCEQIISLAVNFSNKAEIIVGGGITAIEQIMTNENLISDRALQEKACEAMALLLPIATDQLICDNPIVDAVTRVMATHATSLGIAENGIAILKNLSDRNNGYRRLIVDCGGVDIVRALLKRQGRMSLVVREDGHALLRDLSPRDDKVVNNIIAALFLESVNSREKKRLCDMLLLLAVTDDIKIEITLEGGLIAIHQIMASDVEVVVMDDRALQEKACDVMRTLLLAAGDSDIEDVPIIDTVARLMNKYPCSLEIQKNGVGILRNLSERNDFYRTIIARYGIF